MTIKRTFDDKEIQTELTDDELRSAYKEYQFSRDYNNVRFYFLDYTDNDFLEEFGITRQDAEKKFEEIACELRRNIDKYDMSYDYALPAAINDVL